MLLRAVFNQASGTINQLIGRAAHKVITQNLAESVAFQRFAVRSHKQATTTAKEATKAYNHHSQQMAGKVTETPAFQRLEQAADIAVHSLRGLVFCLRRNLENDVEKVGNILEGFGDAFTQKLSEGINSAEDIISEAKDKTYR